MDSSENFVDINWPCNSEVNDGKFKDAQEFAKKVIDDLNESVTAFHFVDRMKTKLKNEGFVEILGRDNWNLSLGGKYYLTRNNSMLVAFTIGKKTDVSKFSFRIIGGHTDSPHIRLAPNAHFISNEIEEYNIQTYGGGWWQTWFDRDLSLAGKLIVKDENNDLKPVLIRIRDPIMRIPNLPIHLTTTKNVFEWNDETHLKAFIATTFFDKPDSKSLKEHISPLDKKLGSKLFKVLSQESGYSASSIKDFDLILYDTHPSCLLGIQKEFVSSGRLDNLATSIPAVYSIITAGANLEEDRGVNIIALFDNEEVGSTSYQGANSKYVVETLGRIFKVLKGNQNLPEDSLEATFARSFIISCDMAHAFNPNYAEKYQKDHKLLTHNGIGIKVNANNKYTTESSGSALIKDIAEVSNIPLQEFIVRQDSPSGSTIGPMIVSQTGIRAIDIGAPMLAMHSIREIMGILDLYHTKLLFEKYFELYDKYNKDNLFI